MQQQEKRFPSYYPCSNGIEDNVVPIVSCMVFGFLETIKLCAQIRINDITWFVKFLDDKKIPLVKPHIFRVKKVT